jgi:DNA-binding NarL/FixJ family response regulator/tetratricopeptide (TPR) repeat protein
MVLGRDRELGATADFLDGLNGGFAALVISGEPGIGKTALWTAALQRAREHGLIVLSARPAAAEERLAFAALGDLLEPVADSVMLEIPEPQRNALAVALLRKDPGDRRLDRRVVGAATISVIAVLTRTAPVLVAIDDLQWLDGPSARVLEFAARRLERLPVGLLACERTGGDGQASLDVGRVLPEGKVTRLRLGPLSVAALQEVIKVRAGRPLTRRTLARIEHAAGGNPFFALEIARSLPEHAPLGPPVLPLPRNLRALVDSRIAALPKRAREALLPVAVLRSPTAESVAAGQGGTASGSRRALEHASAAGIVEVGSSPVRFSHPLFAAAVYWSATPKERRQVHRRLAQHLGDVEERAWHLALAAERADGQLARVLDIAAEHARARGAPETAVELIEYALRLTPPSGVAEIHRRSVQAAEYKFHAGELARARELLRGVLELAPGGRVRADALRLLGEIHYHERSFPEAARLFEQALEHVGDDAALAATLELHLTYAANAKADWKSAETHARRALQLIEQLGDKPRLAEALAVSAMCDYLRGRGLDAAKLGRALELEDEQRQTTVEMRPSLIAGLLMLYEGNLGQACQMLEGLRQRALDRGEESDIPFLSGTLSWVECWRGNLVTAAAYADEAVESAARTGMESLRCMALAHAALPSAYLGDAETTHSRANEALALVGATGYVIGSIWARWALAALALSLCDPAAANAALAPLTAQVEQEGIAEPVRVMFVADAIEALVAVGQLGRAEWLTSMLEQAAQRLDRSWALVQAGRCRALLLAAHGDLAAASQAVGAALRRGEGIELQLELARTLLAAGQIERRARKKRTARELLERALQIFEAAGAHHWVQQTRAELERAVGRATGDKLTASEEHVARLTASGLTNRQVAAQLFMSPKTVEANLARIYRKLGVSSRAALGARLAGADRGRSHAQEDLA